MNRKQGVITLLGISGLLLTTLITFLTRELLLFLRKDSDRSDRPILLRYIPVFMIFIVGIIIASLMFLYYFPEIRPNRKRSGFPQSSSPFDVIVHISNTEEVKILEAIKQRGNKAYQFELSRDTGLNRMKVHRVVYRLVERDMLHIEKIGKNKLLRISPWLLD